MRRVRRVQLRLIIIAHDFLILLTCCSVASRGARPAWRYWLSLLRCCRRALCCDKLAESGFCVDASKRFACAVWQTAQRFLRFRPKSTGCGIRCGTHGAKSDSRGYLPPSDSSLNNGLPLTRRLHAQFTHEVCRDSRKYGKEYINPVGVGPRFRLTGLWGAVLRESALNLTSAIRLIVEGSQSLKPIIFSV